MSTCTTFVSAVPTLLARFFSGMMWCDFHPVPTHDFFGVSFLSFDLMDVECAPVATLLSLLDQRIALTAEQDDMSQGKSNNQ